MILLMERKSLLSNRVAYCCHTCCSFASSCSVSFVSKFVLSVLTMSIYRSVMLNSFMKLTNLNYTEEDFDMNLSPKTYCPALRFKMHIKYFIQKLECNFDCFWHGWCNIWPTAMQNTHYNFLKKVSGCLGLNLGSA